MEIASEGGENPVTFIKKLSDGGRLDGRRSIKHGGEHLLLQRSGGPGQRKDRRPVAGKDQKPRRSASATCPRPRTPAGAISTASGSTTPSTASAISSTLISTRSIGRSCCPNSCPVKLSTSPAAIPFNSTMPSGKGTSARCCDDTARRAASF